jgi:hypothetical protein
MQENGSVPLTSADEILEFRHNLATNAHDPSDLQVISLQITFLTVFHAKGQSFSEHRFHWRHSSVDACLRFGHNSRQPTYEYHSFSPLLSSGLLARAPSHICAKNTPRFPLSILTNTNKYLSHAPALPSTSFNDDNTSIDHESAHLSSPTHRLTARRLHPFHRCSGH